jgi:predicted nucleic acid-binding protein
MKIYLDVCCLNRPFDDQAQDRIRLEAEAILLILSRMAAGNWAWVSSEVIIDEIEQTPDPKRRERVRQLVTYAQHFHILTDEDITRANALKTSGFNSMDALHLACAESSHSDYFLTTDDKLRRRAMRLQKQLRVTVDNPLNWLTAQQEID